MPIDQCYEDVQTSLKERHDLIEQYLLSGVDTLVIANNAPHVKPLFELLFTLLLPGSTFCVYNPYIEPLAEVYDWLKEHESAIILRLSETWFREYQVSPEKY
jgi:tRNA A58 N-methylase Trm61